MSGQRLLPEPRTTHPGAVSQCRYSADVHSSGAMHRRVVGLADGDMRSVLREGKAVTVWLHSIDTPEKAPAFGTRARQFESELAFWQTVTV